MGMCMVKVLRLRRCGHMALLVAVLVLSARVMTLQLRYVTRLQLMRSVGSWKRNASRHIGI